MASQSRAKQLGFFIKMVKFLTEKIINTVSDHFGLAPCEIFRNTKLAHICVPRQVAMYLIAKHTERGHAYTAERFGMHAHSSHHATKLIATRIDLEPRFAAQIEAIEHEINEWVQVAGKLPATTLQTAFMTPEKLSNLCHFPGFDPKSYQTSASGV